MIDLDIARDSVFDNTLIGLSPESRAITAMRIGKPMKAV